MRDATILHADLDSFYAAVEQRDNPRLKGKPVIVGGGVVLAASYEAKARGVRTAMGGRQARRLCPDAVVVPPRMNAYSEASRAVFAVFADFAPVVEGLSIDEAFLDVSGLEQIKGTPVQIARALRQRIGREVGLPITVGIASSKFVAKVASAVAKPDGLLLVEAGRELEFLHPLPVERLWGVGKVTAAKLHARGIRIVAEAAALSELELIEIVGRASGRHLHALAWARDPRRVRPRARRRSVGAQRALGSRPRPWSEVQATLIALVDRVTRRMRAAGRLCRTIVLRLRFSDYTRATRSLTMPQATAQTHLILKAAGELLSAARPLIAQRGLTLVGISLTNLADQDAVQLVLPFERPYELDLAIDRVRERFGNAALTRGVLVGRDPGIEMPLLPDPP